LKLTEGVSRQGAKDTVDSSRIETQLSETHLQLGDVVAPQHRLGQIQESLAELPTSLRQTLEGRGVHLARDGQTP
jgi:hypothetical protein